MCASGLKKTLVVLLLGAAGTCLAGRWDGRALTERDVAYYRTSPHIHCDTFTMRGASLGRDAEYKRTFWAGVAKSDYPVIYQLMFRRPKDWKPYLPPLEDALRQVDGFFSSADGVPTCPENLYAVTLVEENVTWGGQLEIQDALARHLRDRYGVKTYQWFSEPLKPSLAIQADGWVFDAYNVKDFYSHVESFLLTGLPVVPCIWASGHFERYHLDKSWSALARFQADRMDICRSFGLPVLAFAVDAKGNADFWFRPAPEPGEQLYREDVRHYLSAATKAERPTWPTPDKRWRLVVGRDGAVAGKVDLRSFDLTRETVFDDIRSWTLKQEGLTLVGPRGVLNWTPSALGRIVRGTFALRHGKGAKGTFAGVPLAASGVTEVTLGDFVTRPLSLVAEGPVVLQELSFAGTGEPAADALPLEATVKAGKMLYRATRAFTPQDGASILSRPTKAVDRRVSVKVLLPGCGGRLSAQSKVLADLPNSGASAKWTLSLDGTNAVATAASEKKGAWHTLKLEADVPAGAVEAWFLWDLHLSACGSDKCRALADGLSVELIP